MLAGGCRRHEKGSSDHPLSVHVRLWPASRFSSIFMISGEQVNKDLDLTRTDEEFCVLVIVAATKTDQIKTIDVA